MPISARLLLYAFCLFITACQTSAPPEDPFKVPFSIIAKGQHSQLPLAKELVIRDQIQWQHLWLAHTGDPRRQPPKIDFSTEMVMAFFLGQRPTGGYEIEIREIRAESDFILVHINVKRPDPREDTAMALTQTHTMIKLPRYDLPVKFRYYQSP